MKEKFDANGQKRSFFDRRLSEVKLVDYKHNGIIMYQIAE